MPDQTASDGADHVETISELRASFAYGSRSNLDVEFLNELSDAQFGDFLSDLFSGLGDVVDHGDTSALVDAAFRWQAQAYGHGQDAHVDNFHYIYDDTPWTEMTKPLSESRVALMTSSGHFVDGHDPKPFGVEAMTQAEAEARIMDFLAEPPTLSVIPSDTSSDKIRVRHGGYPVRAAKADHQVVLPLRIMETLDSEGVIGEFAAETYTFVGAAAQGRLKKTIGPEWGEMLKSKDIDAVLLVPI